MRIVVFTGNPDLETTPWWQTVLDTPGLSAILVVRQTQSKELRDVLSRLRKNIRKHGLIFLPYRITVALIAATRSLFTRHPSTTHFTRNALPVAAEVLSATDIHAPAVLDRVSSWKPDLGISLGAPVLKPHLFTIPPEGTLNLHLGRVPDYRGAPPAFWELWFNATEIGATIHWIDATLDTGHIIEEAIAPIYPHDTLSRVERRAEELGVTLLAAALRRVAVGRVPGKPQRAGGRSNRAPTLRQRFTLWIRLALRRAQLRLANPVYPAKTLFAFAWLAVIRPLRDIARTILGTHPLRVFTFHRVTDLCRDGMTVPPDVFEKQVAYVRRRHDVVDLHQALDVVASKRRLRKPLAVITFDDGYGTVYRTARPVMDEKGVTGTCFVCPGLVDTDERFAHDRTSPVRPFMDVMSWQDIADLCDAGWRVGGHTETHPRLSLIRGAELEREVREPLRAVQMLTGESIVAMAYPFGGPDDIAPEGVAVAAKCGYSALFSDYGGENFPGDEPFNLRRIDIGGDHDTLMWKAAVCGLDLGKLRRRWRKDDAA